MAERQQIGPGSPANIAGRHEEFDTNVLLDLAHYLDYDFISIGDISACKPEDEVCEYEDTTYYIRAVKNGNTIKCINIIGSADRNGVIKNAFIHAIETRGAALDAPTVCFLKEKGFTDSDHLDPYSGFPAYRSTRCAVLLKYESGCCARKTKGSISR